MDQFDFQPEKPLDRCKGETAPANRGLHDYALLGPGRSLRKLVDLYRRQKEKAKQDTSTSGLPVPLPPTTTITTLETWSRSFAWQARIAAWEQLLAAEDQRKWSDRRDMLREDEWLVGSELVELVKSMLAESPKFIKSTRRQLKDGREIVTVELNGKFLVEAAEMASKLRRLAVGLESAGRTTSLNIDMTQLTDEQVEQIANGEDPLRVLAGAATSEGRD